jgi:hypothetical protein
MNVSEWQTKVCKVRFNLLHENVDRRVLKNENWFYDERFKMNIETMT